MRYGEKYGDKELWEGSLYVFDKRMHMEFTPDTVTIGKANSAALHLISSRTALMILVVSWFCSAPSAQLMTQRHCVPECSVDRESAEVNA